MNPDTVSALLALNRRFYRIHAADFDATRTRPWRGWDRILDHLPPPGSRPLAVLDVGCGNGRFASYLRQARRGPIDYFGVDSSESLLALAAERCRHLARARLEVFELVSDSLQDLLGVRRFDLIAVFGLLHHLPGAANRKALIAELAGRLSTGGLLAPSIWQLHRAPGFERKTVSWKRYNQRRSRRRRDDLPPAPTLELDELETGDYLLSWRGSDDPPRYCHFPGAAEIEGWIAASGLRLLDRFEADGASGGDNLYLLLGRETSAR